MKLVKPNYSQRTPIVNEDHFMDARVGGKDASYNPGQKAQALPTGPPKYIQVPGKRPYSKGLTNKRITQNI